MIKPIHLVISFFLIVSGCLNRPKKLPILGEKSIEGNDTSFHLIPDFVFINQDSQMITNETFANHIYVSDFFFTSCPTICPKVKRQMLRIRDAYAHENRLLMLSHSIDYRKDSVPVLKKYCDKLGIEGPKWHFVQLEKGQLEYIANQYFNVAFEDETAPGGYDHSGRIILVDPERKIRSYCDGTDPEDVDRFIKDIQILLNEI